MIETLFDTGWLWLQSKLALKHAIAISGDSVHVMAGVVIMIGAALLLRKPLSRLTPWLAVLAFAASNEFIDLYFQRWPQRDMQYAHGVKDMLLTMLLPTILLVAFRYFSALREPVEPRRSGDS